MLRFTALTLFPEMFQSIRQEGVVARALKQNIIALDTVQLRDFSDSPRRNVDEKPAGGGDGMVLRADIAQKALLSVKTEQACVIHLTPAGKVFHNGMAKELAQQSHLIFLCGRYAGFDERFVQQHAHMHVSVGDFVLSGGELAALCMIDAVSRFLPDVLGNAQSAKQDSFEDGLLEAPSYTKPSEFCGIPIPPVLMGGHHQEIESYRRKEQIRLTAQRRPDLILLHWDQFSKQEKTFIEKIWRNGK